LRLHNPAEVVTMSRNMADAILIELYAVAAGEKGQRFGFVTHNTKDFSHSAGDNNLPHPDIAGCFSRIKSRYFITLGEALRALGSEENADLMIEQDWAAQPPRRLSEIVAAEEEFFAKVRYNRHMVRREKVEDGVSPLGRAHPIRLPPQRRLRIASGSQFCAIASQAPQCTPIDVVPHRYMKVGSVGCAVPGHLASAGDHSGILFRSRRSMRKGLRSCGY